MAPIYVLIRKGQDFGGAPLSDRLKDKKMALEDLLGIAHRLVGILEFAEILVRQGPLALIGLHMARLLSQNPHEEMRRF